MSEAAQFDRSEENIGNVLILQHINLCVPDLYLATIFYVSGIGLTRDPYVDFGGPIMWVNAGEQQFHLLQNTAQKWRGHIGVVVPSLDDLKTRLERVGKPLADTEFAWREADGFVQVTCPWGNDIRVFGPDSFPGCYLGIPYAEMLVAPGTAEGIARFYERILDAPATVTDDNEGKRAEISMGFGQQLIYQETDGAIPEYDGHHIAIHIHNFSAPHAFLAENDLLTEESDQHQYRFQAIVDPDSGETLAELEHEVRSLKHPMFKRNLVNRNSAQTFFNYVEGRDAFYPG